MSEFLPLSDLDVYWFSFDSAKFSSRYVDAFEAAKFLANDENFSYPVSRFWVPRSLYAPFPDCPWSLAAVRPHVYYANPKPRALPVAVVSDGLPLWLRLPRERSLTACEALLVHLYILRTSVTPSFADSLPPWVYRAVSRAWIPTEAPAL